jgi:hypothetical protein
MKSSNIKVLCGGVAKLCRLVAVACVAVALAAGCSKGAKGSNNSGVSQGNVPTDPQVVSNLDTLTRQLRHCMNRGPHLSGSFDEFVQVAQITPPPPPPGKKYAINQNWHVILVDANAK